MLSPRSEQPAGRPEIPRGPDRNHALASRWELRCDSRVTYQVRLCDGLLDPANTVLADTIADRRTLVVTTPTVARLHGEPLRRLVRQNDAVSLLVLEVTEASKTLAQVETVCRQALAHGLTRRGLLVSVGGGVCSDVVTLAASLVRRGIGYIRVPTTLTGQIDAGIGLKGGVNFAGKKSFLGCFHPPEQVLIDPAFLASLPRRFLVSGMAESIKLAVGRDARLFELLESHGPELVESAFTRRGPEGREILQRSIGSMLEELGQNPYEDRSYERLVDFGHTFSPAIESALGFEIHHGEAVAIDLALSATLSEALGHLSTDAHRRIIALLRCMGLPITAKPLGLELCSLALAEAARHRGGSVNLVVPTGIGRTLFLRRRAAVPDAALQQALDHLARLEEEAA